MERTFELYRNVEVRGAIGRIIFRGVPMPLEIALEIWGKDRSIPLDIVPVEYWSPPELPFSRFGEEMLGKEF